MSGPVREFARTLLSFALTRTRLAATELEEQALHASDMIQVRVRDEDRPRWRTVARQVRRERVAAAVDHQQRLAVALDDRRGRSEFDRLRTADAEKAQSETHGIGLPVPTWLL